MISNRMSRLFLMTPLLLCLGVVAAIAQGKIEVVGGDTYDWGTVAPGKLKAAITVRNIGVEELKISEVKTSCGCTAAPIDKNVLQPGEEGTIDVTLDVISRTGPVEKTITVASTDKDNPYYVVHLKATVRRSVTLVPSNYFVIVEGEKGVTTEASPIRIMNTGDQPFTVSPPELTAGNVKIEFPDMSEPRELQPGETLELKASITPLDDKYVSGEISLATTSPEMPRISLTVAGNMKPVGTTSAAPNNQ